MFAIGQNKEFADEFIELPQQENHCEYLGFIGLVKKPLNLKRDFLSPDLVTETPKLNKRVKKAMVK